MKPTVPADYPGVSGHKLIALRGEHPEKMGLGDWVKKAARRAGRTVEEASDEYTEGKIGSSLPHDEAGNAKIVCRRYAERRAVELEGGRPECFEAGNDDCESCVVDIRDGHVETWE